MNSEGVVPVKSIHRQNFLFLFFSRFISDLGIAVFKFSLSLYVLDVTGSAAIFSLMLTLTILPGVIVNVFAGVIVDKYDKKKIIIISDLLCGIVVFFIFMLLRFFPENMTLFVFYVIGVSIIQSFLNLSINASLPNIVEESAVPKANSLFQAMGAIITIVGPIVSGVLYVWMGIELVVMLNALSFFLGALLSAFLRFQWNDKAVVEEQSDRFLDNLTFVFQYVRERSIIRFFLVNLLILNFVYMPLTMLVVQYITYNVLDVSGIQLSIIQASLGVGVIGGAIYVGAQSSFQKVLRRFPYFELLLGVFVALWCFPALSIFEGMPLWQTVLGFSLVLLVVGFIYTASIIPIYTFFQVEVPENLRGRIFGVATSALNVSIPAGIVLYGVLLEKLYWPYVIGFSSVMIIGLTIYSWGSLSLKETSMSVSANQSEGVEKS